MLKTPVIIGFLVYLNGPCTTKCFVAAQGARVPLPILSNNNIVHINKNNPIKSITIPIDI